jgi:hypothetical protein
MGDQLVLLAKNGYEDLKVALDEAAVDAKKFYGKGNLAAGTRLRKKLMEIKRIAQAAREEIQAAKKKREKIGT